MVNIQLIINNIQTYLTNIILRRKRLLIMLVLLIYMLLLPRLNPSECEQKLYLHEMTSVLNRRDTTREAIFFTETSGNNLIRPRFVCAVESAARLNPQSDVYLLIAYLNSNFISLRDNVALSNVLKHHKNIQVLRVDMPILFKDTQLEEFYSSGKLQSSLYLAEHTSDVIRFLTVWRYGGKYFDLDLIITKTFQGLNRFVVHESSYDLPNIASGIFGFEKGAEVGDLVLQIISADFNGTERGHNGPWAFTRAMMVYCKTLVPFMDSEKCFGMHFLEYETIFPIEFDELELYFDESRSEETMKLIRSIPDLHGIHVGNNLAGEFTVNNVDYSQQPLAIIAREYCPRSFWSCDSNF